MNRGEVYVLDLARVWPKVDRALKGKYAVAWCEGLADVSGLATPSPHVRVVLGDELYERPPSKIPTLRARTFTHRVPNVPAVANVADAPLPRGITLLGTIAKLPVVEEYVLFSYWSGLVMDLHYSWLHEHAPPVKVVAAKPRKPRRVEPTKLLREWTGPHAKAVRTLMREALKKPVTKVAMRKLVEAINAYNDEQGNVIDTAEREALMQTLEDIAFAHGLGMLTKQLDTWRDW